MALLSILRVSFAQTGSHDWNQSISLSEGVRLVETRVTSPRNMDIYCLRIDGEEPRIAFTTTDASPACASNSFETLRKTTRNFMRESRADGLQMIAAINADAFSPWPVPWDQESCTDLLGLAVSDGELVSPGSGTPSFVVYDDGSTTMTQTHAGTEIGNIQIAVSGFGFVLQNGSALPSGTDVHPRTGIGLSEDRRFVYWLVVDGRTAASQGATTEEVGLWLLHFGAWTGINMDGGGSSTLVRFDDSALGDGVVLVNNPVGEGSGVFVPTERSNGNNLGVHLLKLNLAGGWEHFD